MRYAHCYFCDDIRFELGGKVSLVGVYGGAMNVYPPPPAGQSFALPKLCIAAEVVTAVDEPFRTLSIAVVAGDTVLEAATIPSEDLAGLQSSAHRDGSYDDPVAMIAIRAHLVISPLRIDGPQSLVVNVTADGEELVAGKLRIKFTDAPPPQL